MILYCVSCDLCVADFRIYFSLWAHVHLLYLLTRSYIGTVPKPKDLNCRRTFMEAERPDGFKIAVSRMWGATDRTGRGGRATTLAGNPKHQTLEPPTVHPHRQVLAKLRIIYATWIASLIGFGRKVFSIRASICT